MTFCKIVQFKKLQRKQRNGHLPGRTMRHREVAFPNTALSTWTLLRQGQKQLKESHSLKVNKTKENETYGVGSIENSKSVPSDPNSRQPRWPSALRSCKWNNQQHTFTTVLPLTHTCKRNASIWQCPVALFSCVIHTHTSVFQSSVFQSSQFLTNYLVIPTIQMSNWIITLKKKATISSWNSL